MNPIAVMAAMSPKSFLAQKVREAADKYSRDPSEKNWEELCIYSALVCLRQQLGDNFSKIPEKMKEFSELERLYTTLTVKN